MTKFHFCLTTGVDGYLPDTQSYVLAECAVDAYDAIVAAIADFKLFEADSRPYDCDWREFFERGCRAPDASMWNFTLAGSEDGPSLSLVGMTADEYAVQSPEL